jgi:hypothetical protein
MTAASRIRHALVVASAIIVGALTYAGVLVAPASAGNPATFGFKGGRNILNAPSVGSPAPGGIYAPFTDCPLNDPVLETSFPGDATGCLSSTSTSGSFAIHGIPVPITHPVTVQLGFYSTEDAQGQHFPVVPPLDGRELTDQPEATPGGLNALLLCPNGINADIAALCKKAATSGHTGLTALVRQAGLISNFNPLASLAPGTPVFTQPIKIQLINQVLGGKCYIGSDSNPIVLNPAFSVPGTVAATPDPNPARFPDVVVLSATGSTLTDTSFTVPVATGCGPGGVADAAIDFLLGLPSPSGANSLVLSNSNNFLADSFGTPDQIDVLKAAFKASGR